MSYNCDSCWYKCKLLFHTHITVILINISCWLNCINLIKCIIQWIKFRINNEPWYVKGENHWFIWWCHDIPQSGVQSSRMRDPTNVKSVWVLRCVFSSSIRLQPLPQTVHVKGFPPVWLFMCLFRLHSWLKPVPHTVQVNVSPELISLCLNILKYKLHTQIQNAQPLCCALFTFWCSEQ